MTAPFPIFQRSIHDTLHPVTPYITQEESILIMRADRLLSLVMLLQTRGKMTTAPSA
ncbi:MAG: hypothetical protein LCI00_29565 [Chloroflexi bacterium]|nr:hypothetical protein [Chloroflexota bacterium]MCC6893367.1 hypothetical protein [Anaerolineae bacterium]